MLIIRELKKTYPQAPGQPDGHEAPGSSAARRVLFEHVNLELAPGAFAAVTGESGAGKSTFLNLIAGLERADAGEIEFAGARITAMGDAELARLRRSAFGFVFQAFHLLPYLTVAENVALPLRLLGRAGDRAARDEEQGSQVRDAGALVRGMLSAVGLADRWAALPQTLSGGEAQRVAIARALVHRPKMILADEPTGNLDADNAAGVLRLLKEQAVERGAAVILVTHSAQAAMLADRAFVLTRSGLRRT